MKLIISVINSDDSGPLMDSLNQAGHEATIISTTGGSPRRTNVTVLMGTEDEKVPEVLGLIRQTCRKRSEYANPIAHLTGLDAVSLLPVEALIGGATVFVLEVSEVYL